MEGSKGEQMRIYDRDLVSVPVPAFLRDGTLIYYPGKGWFRYVAQTVSGDGYWSVIDNPDIEPYWGDPAKHECKTQECADTEKMNAEDVALFGQGQVSGEHLKGFQGGTLGFDLSACKGPFPPDTDEEHELAAGVYLDSEQMNEVEKQQLVLVLPFRNVPNTNACRYIFGDEIQPSRLGEWAALFVKKQADYGDGADDLGEAGQYAELHRKITKLRRALWEGMELQNEPVREVLMDLIGHCFLSMMYVDQPRHTRYPKGNPNK